MQSLASVVADIICWALSRPSCVGSYRTFSAVLNHFSTQFYSALSISVVQKVGFRSRLTANDDRPIRQPRVRHARSRIPKSHYTY